MGDWDGNNYQFWARACMGCALIGCGAALYTGSTGEVFFISVVFGVIGIFIVPAGPQPPDR